MANITGSTTCAQTAPDTAALAAVQPPYEISLGEWSLHRAIIGPRPSDLERVARRAAARLEIKLPPVLRGELAPLDVPAFVRRELDIDAIDWIGHFHAAHLADADYLTELKERADGEGVRGLVLICDSEGAIASESSERRLQVAERHQKWIDAAALLGCHSIRVVVPCVGDPEEQAQLAADGLREIAERADRSGIDVVVENHGGLSSNPRWLVKVMRLADHPRLGVLPDFGNFRVSDTESYDPYRAVAALMPFARGVSAKCFNFDDAGDETTFDFARLMRIVIDSGYSGYIGIEYEGDSLSEVDGVRAAKALLERLRQEIMAETRAA